MNKKMVIAIMWLSLVILAVIFVLVVSLGHVIGIWSHWLETIRRGGIIFNKYV